MSEALKTLAEPPASEGDDARAALEEIARQIRVLSLTGIYHARSGHPGGALSAADLLAALYGGELAIDPSRTDDPDRDRFVLSKGHGAPALYAAWAATGFIEPTEVKGLRKLGSPYQGHPHVLDTPLAETSTGSLGQGFSVALGMALGLEQLGSPARVYTLLGDGELQEGEVWEAAMCAGHFAAANLCAIIDYNKMQSDDLNANIMTLEPLADKWAAFNWQVIEIEGHDMGEILSAFREAEEFGAGPSVIIAHTVKGKGVSFMEGVPGWHGSVALKQDETRQALSELGADPAEIDALLKEDA